MSKKTGVNTSTKENRVAPGLGGRLRDARKRAGLTQVQLAKAVGIDESGLNAWERGGRLPETQSLVRLSETLDVSIDYLLRGKEPVGIEWLSRGLRALAEDAERIRSGTFEEPQQVARVAPAETFTLANAGEKNEKREAK